VTTILGEQLLHRNKKGADRIAWQRPEY